MYTAAAANMGRRRRYVYKMLAFYRRQVRTQLPQVIIVYIIQLT